MEIDQDALQRYRTIIMCIYIIIVSNIALLILLNGGGSALTVGRLRSPFLLRGPTRQQKHLPIHPLALLPR